MKDFHSFPSSFQIVSKSFPSRFQVSFSYLNTDQCVHVLIDDVKQLKQAFVGFCDVSNINSNLVVGVYVGFSP